MKKINRIHIKDSKLIKEIVNKHIIDGITYNDLSHEYQIKWQTIAQWVYQHKKFGWNFKNKTGRNNKNKTIDELKTENEILKKFLLFQRRWEKEKNFLYLSTIIDLYNRNIVAYRISERNDIKLVIDTLKLALKNHKKMNGLILHSDQGFQYTSIQYKNLCQSYGIIPSYSRKGTPIDNAVIESFHSIFKKETIYNNIIKTKHDMLQLIHKWINFKETYRVKI